MLSRSRSSLLSHKIRSLLSRSPVDNNDPLDYTSLSDLDDSDSEPEPIRVATEFCSFGEESLTVPT
jgi:hypothetical protein